jgi:hypothetical protein
MRADFGVRRRPPHIPPPWCFTDAPFFFFFSTLEQKRQRALVLWAHLRQPESAFAQLPLELVCHIMSHLHDNSRSGKHDSAYLVRCPTSPRLPFLCS